MCFQEEISRSTKASDFLVSPAQYRKAKTEKSAQIEEIVPEDPSDNSTLAVQDSGASFLDLNDTSFFPDGGIFVGSLVVSTVTTTVGGRLTVSCIPSLYAAKGLVPFDSSPKTKYAFEAMKYILDIFAFVSLSQTDFFLRILCQRYSFLVNPSIYPWHPHFVFSGGSRTELVTNFDFFQLQYVACIDELSGLPALRYSTHEERCKYRYLAQGGFPEILKFCGSCMNGCTGMYFQTNEKFCGKNVFKSADGAWNLYFNEFDVSWNIGHVSGLSQCASFCKLRQKGGAEAYVQSVIQAVGIWEELTTSNSWSENPSLHFIDQTDYTNYTHASSTSTLNQVAEIQLVCGEYQLSAQVSKQGFLESSCALSQPFTILTWDAISFGFAFDVLFFVKEHGYSSGADIENAVMNNKVFFPSQYPLHSIEQALKVLASSDAFPMHIAPQVSPTGWFSGSEEINGPLLSVSSSIPSDSNSAEGYSDIYTMTLAGHKFLKAGSSLRFLVSGSLYQNPGMPGFSLEFFAVIWFRRLAYSILYLDLYIETLLKKWSEYHCSQMSIAIALALCVTGLSDLPFILAKIMQYRVSILKPRPRSWFLEGAAMGYPLNFLLGPLPPPTSQLGFTLSKLRIRVNRMYAATVVAYFFTISTVFIATIVTMWTSHTEPNPLYVAAGLPTPSQTTCLHVYYAGLGFVFDGLLLFIIRN